MQSTSDAFEDTSTNSSREVFLLLEQRQNFPLNYLVDLCPELGLMRIVTLRANTTFAVSLFVAT
jgi:hypothetical protein